MPNKYRKPPVAQVYCEFRFAPTTEWDITFAGLFYQEVRNEYPIRQRTFLPSAPGTPPERAVPLGDNIQFHREDGSGYLQIAPNLLSINLNPPYPGWEHYLPQIVRVLDSYRAVAQPNGVQRIGLRYVNQIILPSAPVRLEDWFNYYLHSPTDSLPMAHFAAFSQYLYHDQRDILGVQIASGGIDAESHALCLFDLDYGLLTPAAVTLDETSEWLTQAHDAIETRFESFITPRLRETFEPYE